MTLRVWLLGILCVAGPLQAQERFDVVITGGRVVDGTGSAPRAADVGIRDGRVVALGALGGAPANRRIDARGRLVVPGFIDIHSHADEASSPERGLRSSDARRRAAPNLVLQGVTTVVVNQDGRSPVRIGPQRARIEELGIGPNAALLVGHGAVRQAAMGRDVRRPATDAEVLRMRELVRAGMEAGAYGISAGLEYVPGRWSTTDEVVAIVEEIVPFGGIYVSHERSEGSDPMWYYPSQESQQPPSLLDAVRETIAIGERTGAVVVASHIKVKGVGYWGISGEVIDLIARARARGVSVFADQYPYATTGSDGSTVLIPRWVFTRESGRRGSGAGRDYRVPVREVLADAALSDALRRDIAHEIARRGGADRLVVFEYPDSAVIGNNVADLAAARGVSPVEMAIALQLEGYADRRGGARVRGFSLSEDDIDAYARQTWTATASDAGIALPSDGSVHARFYGTFPRKLRRHAIERGILTLEQAIRSMTSLPAEIMGLTDRGVLRVGSWADVVVFDPTTIADNATFFEPHKAPTGIDFVLVNGEFVVDGGVETLALPGVVLTPGPS